MKSGNMSLQDYLIDHLTRSDQTTYQKIELKIAAIEDGVVKVTDDYKHIFELRELSEAIAEAIPKSADPAECKVKLGRWNFESHRASNSKKEYLDITCKNLE